MLALTFQPFHIENYKGPEDYLLPALRDIAADPRQCSSGWPRHFSLEEIELLGNIFQLYGQLWWDDLINLWWIDLVYHVEEAWLALDSGHMHPNEERLHFACLPGAMAGPPPLDCVECASCKKERPPAPQSPPPASASITSTGSVGASGNGRYGISLALQLLLQRTPSCGLRQVLLRTCPASIGK